jgi:hypothetical protein
MAPIRLGSRLTRRTGFEGGLEQGVGAFGEGVYAADERVVGLVLVGEVAAFRFLDRVPDRWAQALVSQVGQGGHALGVGLGECLQ